MFTVSLLAENLQPRLNAANWQVNISIHVLTIFTRKLLEYFFFFFLSPYIILTNREYSGTRRIFAGFD